MKLVRSRVMPSPKSRHAVAATIPFTSPPRTRGDRWRISAATAVLALAASCPCTAAADDDARALNGHTFPRPVSDESAFLPTTVGFRQGMLFVDAGSVTAQGARKPVNQAAAIESLDATVRVVDWLAVSATADLQALVGASEVAVYGTPSQVAGGLRFGPAFRIARLRSIGTQIALRPYYQATFGALLDVSGVIPALRDRIANEVSSIGSVDEADKRATALENDLVRASVTPIRKRAWGGSLHVASAISPQLGVQLAYALRLERFAATSFDLNRGGLPERSLTSVTHAVSGAMSFDASGWGVPLAVLFEVVVAAVSLRAEGDERPSNLRGTLLLGPGLYYTGRRALQLGVHTALEKGLTAYLTPYGRSDTPTAYYGQFTIRYYFE